MLLMKSMVLLLPMVNDTITDNADDVSFIHVDNATLITTDTSFDVTDNFVDTGDNYSTDNLAYDTYYQESMGSCHYLSEEGTCSSDNESNTCTKSSTCSIFCSSNITPRPPSYSPFEMTVEANSNQSESYSSQSDSPVASASDDCPRFSHFSGDGGSALNNALSVASVVHTQELPTYKLVGDNIDKRVVPRDMRSDNQTKTLHYFHVYGVLDRIDLTNEADDPALPDI